jgi:hypothetical protein
MNFHSSWIFAVLVYIFSIYVLVSVFLDEKFLIIIVPLMLISSLGITTSLAVNLALHYRDKSRRFYLSNLFLSIALSAYTIGEVCWAYFDMNGLEPYPSLADPFYVAYFVFSILFCMQIFYCRKNLVTLTVKGISITVSLLVFTVYMIFSWDNIGGETYWLDTLFMVLSSLLIGHAAMAALTAAKAPKLRKVWIILGIALALNSIADIFYYSDTQNYLYADLPNMIWFGTVLMFFYALYLHRFLFLYDGFQR